jgi:hypothetical protein
MRGVLRRLTSLVQRHPVATYFSLVLLVSYGSFAVLFGPKVLRGQAVTAADTEFVLFPVIVPACASLGSGSPR